MMRRASRPPILLAERAGADSSDDGADESAMETVSPRATA